jgi:dTDP-glucose 4,6-dehydratase
MRVLVTGGAGFIGSAVVRRLVAMDWHVLNLDKLTYAANLASLGEVQRSTNYRFAEGDVCDRALLATLMAEFRPQAIMHLAAESHVDRSIMASAAFMQTNVIGTHAMLEAALTYWDGLSGNERDSFRFLHISTDEVFGSLGGAGQFDESTPYDPRSPYSASKAASDHLVRAWHHTYGLPTLVSNCSNNYGPFQFPEKLIPTAILNGLEGKPIEVYGDGLNVRDWLFVDDHVEALLRMVQAGKPGSTYCVGGQSERTNLAVVKAICGLLDEMAPAGRAHEELITFVEDRPGHDRRYAIDASRIRSELGWTPRHAFEPGLRETVRWYLDHAEWWRPIREARHAGGRLGLGRMA